jgi:hypothetical protein
MRRLTYLAVLLLTSLFAAAGDAVIVRSVSVSPSNTFTIEGSGFSPTKGAAPVVTINGLPVTVKSFTDTRIVGTLATSPAGDYTLKVTNSQGHSATFEAVMKPALKADSAASKEEEQEDNSRGSRGTGSSDRAPQRVRPEACEIKEVTPGTIVPPLPSYCFEESIPSSTSQNSGGELEPGRKHPSSSAVTRSRREHE